MSFAARHALLRRGCGCVVVLALLVCAAFVRADAPKPDAQAPARGHTFKFEVRALAGADVRSVHLAGSFNGWNSSSHPMRDDNGDGTYEITVPLDDGVHYYKFVVNGDRWLTDPTADPALGEPDGYGGTNSGVLIGPDARQLGPPKPDHINPEGILFDPKSDADVNVATDTMVRFRIRTLADDVKQVHVNLRTDAGVTSVALQRFDEHLGYDLWGGIARVEGKQLRYWFTLTDGSGKLIVSPDGKTTIAAGAAVDAEPAGWALEMTPAFVAPEWARNAVWYQIFPERFRNGNPDNDPGDFWFENLLPWGADWWKAHPQHGEVAGEDNFYRGAGNVWNRRYGGDIQGLREALPYLRELGINAIYLNPMFEADSMHKYDTTDFRHIDDNFGERDPGIAERKDELKKDRKYRPRGNHIFFELDGTPMPEGYVETDDPATWRWTKSDLIFLDFLKEARAQGFHVIIDGVFNHTGRAHPYFVDVLEKGRNSEFADWFEITDWGDPSNWRKMDDPLEVHGKPGGIRWRAWDGDDGHLPVFKKDAARGLAKGPYDHIMAVTKRWLDPDGDPTTRDGIDGWRLDVPGDIPMPFWIEWRKVVKAANPEAYTSGEIWTWAQPWLKGDQFDAVMNYQFAMPTQSFFVNEQQAITASQYAKRLSALVFNYPLQVALVQQNLFDSHDTDRLASMFVNPDRPYDGRNRIQDNGPDYSPRKPTDVEFSRMLQAIDAQMAFLGAPMLYYGTEAGMWSPDDPSNRQPMIWREKLPYEDPQIQFNNKVFNHVQRLIAIRRHHDVLRAGSFYPVYADDAARVFGFARSLGDRNAYIVINRSDKPADVTIPVVPGRYRDWLSPDQATVSHNREAPDARPAIAAVGDPAVDSAAGSASIRLAPWQTMILIND